MLFDLPVDVRRSVYDRARAAANRARIGELMRRRTPPVRMLCRKADFIRVELPVTSTTSIMVERSPHMPDVTHVEREAERVEVLLQVDADEHVHLEIYAWHVCRSNEREQSINVSGPRLPCVRIPLHFPPCDEKWADFDVWLLDP